VWWRGWGKGEGVTLEGLFKKMIFSGPGSCVLAEALGKAINRGHWGDRHGPSTWSCIVNGTGHQHGHVLWMARAINMVIFCECHGPSTRHWPWNGTDHQHRNGLGMAQAIKLCCCVNGTGYEMELFCEWDWSLTWHCFERGNMPLFGECHGPLTSTLLKSAGHQHSTVLWIVRDHQRGTVWMWHGP
jgi:hypothetical protein